MPATARPAPARRPASQRMLDSIYNAAAELIVRKGYQATTLTEVAQAVGLAKSGIYHHIRSKEDLLYEIVRHGMDRLTEQVIAPARATPDPAERLAVLARQYAGFVVGAEDGSGVGPQVTTLVHESRELSPARQREAAAARWNFYRFVRATIQELIDHGRYAPIDASVAAMNFFGAMVWLAQWYRPGGRLSRQEVIENMVRWVCAPVLGAPPRRRNRIPKELS